MGLDFAAFGIEPPTRRSSSTSSSSSASSRDSEIDALNRQIKLLELRAKLAELEGPRNDNKVVNEEQVAIPVTTIEGAKLKGTIDMKTGTSRERTTIKVNFRFSERKFGILQKKFPGIIFAQPDYGGHDHPLAHVETIVATRRLQQLIPAGDKVLDLYGNPSANETFNKTQGKRANSKRIDTAISIMTAKDPTQSHQIRSRRRF
jgi:hypothetical protein